MLKGKKMGAIVDQLGTIINATNGPSWPKMRCSGGLPKDQRAQRDSEFFRTCLVEKFE